MQFNFSSMSRFTQSAILAVIIGFASACTPKIYIPPYEARLSPSQLAEKYEEDKRESLRSEDVELLNEIHRRFSELQEVLNPLSDKLYGSKLASKYGITPRIGVQTAIAEMEIEIMNGICERGSLKDLEFLYENFPKWKKGDERDSLRRTLVNEALNPWQTKKCKDSYQHKEDSISSGHCKVLMVSAFKPTIGYRDATLIINRFHESVYPENYPYLWQLNDRIWEVFKSTHPLREMSRFKIEHPDNDMANDLAFDNVKDTLHLESLSALLALHRNNPGTLFERDIW